MPPTSPPPKNACRKRKADTSRPCSVPIPLAMQEAIIRRAEAEDRSFSSVIRCALNAYFDQTPA